MVGLAAQVAPELVVGLAAQVALELVVGLAAQVALELVVMEVAVALARSALPFPVAPRCGNCSSHRTVQSTKFVKRERLCGPSKRSGPHNLSLLLLASQ
ncbi:hypothetical protein KSD_94030 [Ktedonobacter sp. SOSP1-85]|nr:hypothetical protein KSD_94030 [Ktedonobacter sp. SOSP1-85]